MKTIRTIYAALMFVVLALMTACSTDIADPISGGGSESQAGKVTLHLTLSTSSAKVSRALTPTWTDGTDAENMKSWVVAFVKNNQVVSFAENKSVAEGHRIKDDVTITGLTNGETYQVYSFANLSADELGISQGASVDFENKTWRMNGNGFDVTSADSKGIPMINKQEVTINSDGKPSISALWVVRMLAKVTLRFKNPSSTALVINSITLNDITQNPTTADNIMLLPKHSDANKDEIVCEPNLATTAESSSYTYALPTAKTIVANKNDYEEISFYVNESLAGKTSKYFIVNLNTSNGIKRYALFKDWTTIARNDHHILPISLDDYKLKFKVEAFSAIGLYPSLTDNGTTLSYTCYYPEEEFHIKPKVLKASDDTEVSGIDYSKMTLVPINEDGTEDVSATDAKEVFETQPKLDTKTGLIEGVFKGDAANKKSVLYKLTVPVTAEKSLEYKLLFTKDLTAFAARKYYTRKFYRYE